MVCIFFVSNISYINNGLEYFILDRKTGQPLEDAKVEVWKQKYDSKSGKDILEKKEFLTADENGYIKLSENKDLEKVISELKHKLKRLDLYYFDKIKNATLSYDEHNEIIKALQKKDLVLALNAVEDNWKNSFSRFKL